MANMYIFTAALVIAGWVAAVDRFAARARNAREREELRLEFQRQIDSLSASVRSSRTSSCCAARATERESTVANPESSSEAVMRTTAQ